MNKKYTHLFFDLDNTLWNFKTNSYNAMKDTFKNFRIAEQGPCFDSFFSTYLVHNENMWTAYREKKIKKKGLIEKRFLLTFEELGIKNISPREIDDFYLQTIAQQPLLENGAIEILDYAKQKGYKLHIITNGFKEIQYKKMQSSGITGYFGKIFVSEDVKVPKPGREIFEYAIKSTNAKKQQSLMIGDDWEADIVGAQNFGIDSVFLGDAKEYDKKRITNNNVVSQIDNLKGLFKIV